jgi:hypothetical protein
VEELRDQGRLKSFPVQEDRHFLTFCRYVDHCGDSGRDSGRVLPIGLPRNYVGGGRIDSLIDAMLTHVNTRRH